MRQLRYVAGGTQHPETGLRQLWITFDSGQHIHWIRACHARESVLLAMQLLHVLGRSMKFSNRGEAIVTILESLYVCGEENPLPVSSMTEERIRMAVAGGRR